MVLFKKKYTYIFMKHKIDDEFSPKIGSNHQTLIPFHLSYSEEDVYNKPLSFAICLFVTVSWSHTDVESFVLTLFLF